MNFIDRPFLKSPWAVLFLCAAFSIFLIYFIPQSVAIAGSSFVVAYLLNPLIEKISHSRLRDRKLGRDFAIATVVGTAFFIFAILCVVMIPQMAKQASLLWLWVPTFFEKIREFLGSDHEWLASLQDTLTNWDWGASFKVGVKTLFGTASAIFTGAFALIFVPVLTFYWLREYPHFIEFLDASLSEERKKSIFPFFKNLDRVLSGFLRGQVLVICFLSFWYSLVFGFLQLEGWLFLGVLAGTMNFIPYVGPAIAAILVCSVSLLGGGESIDLAWIGGAFVLGNLTENLLITPRVVGDKVGLSPLGVVLSLLIAGEAFGVPGLIVAIPLAAALKSFFLENLAEAK